jgi:hypothetical protein
MLNINLTQFKEFAEEAITYDDPKLASKLVSLLNKQDSLTPELTELRTTLRWIKFQALSDELALELLQTTLLIPLQHENWDLVEKIGKKLAFLELPQEQTAFMQSALQALDKNAELIGGTAIKDWVKNYYNFSAAAAKRSNLDEINFVNQYSGTKGLNEQEKTFVLVILKIADSLRNVLQGLQEPDFGSEEQAFPKNFDYSTLIPGIIHPEYSVSADL